MNTLSPAAAQLLSDMARSYGLRDLALDADGMVRVEISGQALVIAFSQAWGRVFLSSVLAYEVALSAPRLFRAFTLRDRFRGRTTRIAREPVSHALLLVTDIDLDGLHYPAFVTALDDFLADERLARRELALGRIDP